MFPWTRQTAEPTGLTAEGVGHIMATAGGARIESTVIAKLLTYALVVLLTNPMTLITRLESAALQVQMCIKVIVRS